MKKYRVIDVRDNDGSHFTYEVEEAITFLGIHLYWKALSYSRLGHSRGIHKMFHTEYSAMKEIKRLTSEPTPSKAKRIVLDIDFSNY